MDIRIGTAVGDARRPLGVFARHWVNWPFASLRWRLIRLIGKTTTGTC